MGKFLIALDADRGAELYIGSEGRFVLLKEINEGSGDDSLPTGFTLLPDGKVLFVANDGDHGAELWVTDGSAGGTRLLTDIDPGDGGSSPFALTTLLDGRILFSADDGSNGRQVWITDGSANGTVLLKDIEPTTYDSFSDFVLLPSGLVIFAADDGVHGSELWVTDGTPDGTALLKDIRQGEIGSEPYEFALLPDGRLLFAASDGIDGGELWVTDGTFDGTTLVKDINPGSAWSNPRDIVVLSDGRSLFIADDGTHGEEIWVTDGTADRTTLLKDIRSGDGWSQPHGFVEMPNGDVLFSAYDGAEREVWITNGTSNGTAILKDIAEFGSSDPSSFVLLPEGQVVFSADDGTHGEELWITDGTADGTKLLKDIKPGYEGSDPGYFVSLPDGQVLFRASSWELWITDGTASGTHKIDDDSVVYGSQVFGLPATSAGIAAAPSYQYSEGQVSGFLIGEVESFGFFGAVSFQIIGGNDEGLFAIDNEGRITLTTKGAANSSANDYETGPNSFTLTVQAESVSGETDTVSVGLVVRNITGTLLTGDKKADVLDGTQEEDVLAGKNGKDVLAGLGGNDTLNGGKHKDNLSGGLGEDLFVFDAKLKDKWADRVLDFETGVDTIALDRSIFKKIGKPGELKPKFFDLGKEANSAKDRLLYHEKSGWLRFDRDGDKSKHDPIKVAKLQKNLELSAEDFLVIS